MKLNLLLTIGFLWTLILPLEKIEPESLSIDKSESTLTWKATKLTGGHHGKVLLDEANLNMDAGKLTGGSFVIDMASITCEDLTNEASNKRLVDHLKSDDFFSVDNYPKSNFVITEAKSSNGTDYEVTGNLTIKGVTKPVSFPAKVQLENGKYVALAAITFDRTQYDIKYRSGNYFENLADKLIYDEVQLDVKLVAMNP
ncbi:YceI family protein [Pararhodonellum marinum]|uniref:YceI family protein n=1 Tax=Pararhodonellum marinum TaxID=2755358 RepID=UPI00188DDFC1|nr:YceI family protein [Pararhodonellum marinum]